MGVNSLITEENYEEKMYSLQTVSSEDLSNATGGELSVSEAEGILEDLAPSVVLELFSALNEVGADVKTTLQSYGFDVVEVD